jgi:isocitrate dehydrogenase
MAVHRIAVIGGDGIGPEVIDQAVRVATAAVGRDHAELHWTKLPWSTAYYKQHGRMLPEDGWQQIQAYDAILFGAVGDPSVPDKITVHELLLPMRRKFDQYVNLRPAYLFPGVPCPLVGKAPGSIDMLVFRENTEGEYAPVGGNLYPGTENQIAIQTGVFTWKGCERILRAAFSAARNRPRKMLTSITKSNAQVYGLGLWDDVSLRRHTHRSERRRDRKHRAGFQRQHQPAEKVPEHVRAGSRQCSRYRRQGDRESARGHPFRGTPARSPRSDGKRRGRAERGGKGTGHRVCANPRPRRTGHNHADGRCGRCCSCVI